MKLINFTLGSGDIVLLLVMIFQKKAINEKS